MALLNDTLFPGDGVPICVVWIGLSLGIFRPCRGHPSSDIVRFYCLFEIGRRHIDDQMTNSPVLLPGSEFNDFLFAPIGEDRNGMLVSVLSGLARSDVDPWQEATRLAELPWGNRDSEIGLIDWGSSCKRRPRCGGTPKPSGVFGRHRGTSSGRPHCINKLRQAKSFPPLSNDLG
jgi:hypothetical protein